MATLAQKYAWLITTIKRHGKISLNDLEIKWGLSQLNPDNTKFDRSKMNRWRTAIKEQFGLEIKNECIGDYRYYLANPEVLEEENINTWLLENIAVSNAFLDYRDLSHRIVLDPVEKGVHLLPTILQAFRNSEAILITYRNTSASVERTVRVEPYALRHHQNRWYLLAKSQDNNLWNIYSLNNILKIEIKTGDNFKIPNTFNADAFFMKYYGVEIASNQKPEKLKLRVCESLAQKFKDQPLHRTQKELKTDGQSTVFEYWLTITPDVIKTILSFGSDIEILENEDLRFQILYEAEALKRIYDDPIKPIFGGDPALVLWPKMYGKEWEPPKIDGDFLAVNIELANYEPAGFCAISYVKVHDGEIVKEYNSLVKPMPYKFDEDASDIIKLEDLDDAPTLPEIWNEIKDDFENLPIVSYVCEDIGGALDVFGIKHKELNRIALKTVVHSKLGEDGAWLTLYGACAKFGIEMGASSDSLQRAKKNAALALKLL